MVGNSRKIYLQLLSTEIQEFMNNLPLHQEKNVYFQQDGVPPHNSQVVLNIWTRGLKTDGWVQILRFAVPFQPSRIIHYIFSYMILFNISMYNFYIFLLIRNSTKDEPKKLGAIMSTQNNVISRPIFQLARLTFRYFSEKMFSLLQ